MDNYSRPRNVDEVLEKKIPDIPSLDDSTAWERWYVQRHLELQCLESALAQNATLTAKTAEGEAARIQRRKEMKSRYEATQRAIEQADKLLAQDSRGEPTPTEPFKVSEPFSFPSRCDDTARQLVVLANSLSREKIASYKAVWAELLSMAAGGNPNIAFDKRTQKITIDGGKPLTEDALRHRLERYRTKRGQ